MENLSNYDPNAPILHTKIQLPITPNGLVVRPRLLRKLDESTARTKLTVLCSPAGYGKTTLVSSWIRERQTAAAWVSLELKDNDMHAFWSCIVAAIDPVFAGLAARMAPLLNNMNPASFETGLIFLLNECHRYALPIVLVLDDFHTIGLPELHASVFYFAERLPANVHLMLLTRTELPFRLSKMVASGHVTDISMADLRFEQDEADVFYKQKMHVQLPSDVTKQWTYRTEGWATGMQLTALLAQKSGSAAEHWELSGEDRLIADYLWEEVFLQQTEEVQSFLLRTSVLDRFCAPLCDLLTGREDTREMLAMLERNQLFLIPLDRRRGWYRYHHLFSEFLRKQLHLKSRSVFTELHASAAAWFMDNGYEEEAVEHYLEGNWMNEAAMLITRLIPTKIKQKWSLLYRWIGAVPEQIMNEQPALFLTKISLAFLFKEAEEAERLLRLADVIYERQCGLWKQDDAERYYTDLLALKALLAIERKDMAATFGYLKEYAQLAKEESLFVHAHLDAEMVTMLRYYPGLEGKLRYAEPSFRQLMELMQYGPPLAASMFAIGYAEVLYEWNRLEEAQSVVLRYLEIGKKLNGIGLIVPLTALLSRILKAGGEEQAARLTLEDTLAYPDIANNLFYANLINVQKIRLKLDGWDGARVTSEEVDGFRPSDGMNMQKLNGWEMFEALIRVKAMLATGKPDEALAWLTPLWNQASDRDWLMDKIEIALLRSMAWLDKQDQNTAVRFLSQALKLGAPDGYTRIFIDAGQPVVSLMAEYMSLRKNNHIRDSEDVPISYVKLLATELRIASSTDNDDLASRKLVQLTSKELEVLRLIVQGLQNQQIANELRIGSGTVKTHIHRIYGKLQVNSRIAAIERCNAWGLL